jgi:hypothetical protein
MLSRPVSSFLSLGAANARKGPLGLDRLDRRQGRTGLVSTSSTDCEDGFGGLVFVSGCWLVILGVTHRPTDFCVFGPTCPLTVTGTGLGRSNWPD